VYVELAQTKRGLRYDFSLIAILLVPIGVAINVVVALIVQLLKLPVYLDTIGTALTAMIGGPWMGMTTGLITNILKGIYDPFSFAFIPVQLLIGLVVGLLSISGMLTKIWKVVVSGLILTLLVTLISAPIQVIAFGGIAGNSSDALVAVLVASGQQLWTAVFSKTILVEIIDKIITLLFAYLIVQRMTPRYLSKLNYGEIYIKKKSST
jgi:energy-coupling factor transport system substrate-specific component